MARHQLIAVQLDTLTDRLPAAAVAELADGLDETFEALLAQLGNADAAAAATLEEFGDADTITAAFFRDSPWRRLALGMLATGPVMGIVWGGTLISQHAWDWPIPVPARILYGAVLLTVVAILISAVREERAYRRTRLAATGCAIGFVVLDALMLVAVTTLATIPGWAVTIAVGASVIRILCVVRALPAVLAS